MAMNLPSYSRQTAEAHEKFRERLAAANNEFGKASMAAAEDLDETLRSLRSEFFDDET